MRYCVFTLVSAMLAAAIGCQTPLHNGGFGSNGAVADHGVLVGQGGFAKHGGKMKGFIERGGPMDRSPMRAPVDPGAVPAWFNGMNGANPSGPVSHATSQIQFLGPDGMIICYDVSVHGMFDSEPLSCPGVHNFGQGAVYRLKLSNVPSMPGRDLYPTIEIAPTFARSEAFLAHNMIPVEFTDNDFDQVASGNFITKVIYLPNPEFQSIATAGVGTLVNTQLEPGVDPIVEAENRGTILAVLRIGNKDLSMEAIQMQVDASGASYVSSGSVYGMQQIPNAPELPVGTRAPRTSTVRPIPLVAPPQPEMMQ